MNNKILIIISLGVILSVIYFSYQSGNEYKLVKENGLTEVCTIATRGSDVICSFKIKGQDLTRRLSKPHEYIKSGEQFKVYYYDKIPDRYYISFAEPIINKEKFSKTESTEVSVRGSRVTFKYEIDNRVIERSQKIEDNVKINTKGEFLVMYKKEDPEIAYLIIK